MFWIVLFFTSYFEAPPKQNRRQSPARGCHYGTNWLAPRATPTNKIKGVLQMRFLYFVTGVLCACAGLVIACKCSEAVRNFVIPLLGGGA